jgi:hypothetical protein
MHTDCGETNWAASHTRRMTSARRSKIFFMTKFSRTCSAWRAALRSGALHRKGASLGANVRTSSQRGSAYNPSRRLGIGARGSSITFGLRLILVNFSSLAAFPLFAPLAPLLRRFPGDRLPPLELLNSLADMAVPPVLSGGLRPIRFVAAGLDVPYEPSIFQLGLVPTRVDNWHDFFNALIWLTFPQTKGALNACHLGADGATRGDGAGLRGRQRDAVTHFDECGVIVVCNDPRLLEMLRQHEWHCLFWRHRAQVGEAMRFYVFGHATYDLLRAPFVGLCAKAVFFEVSAAFLSLPLAGQMAELDRRLAERWSCGKWYLGPKDFSPLPLLGIPGVTPDSEVPEYYEDPRQFRPMRRA